MKVKPVKDTQKPDEKQDTVEKINKVEPPDTGTVIDTGDKMLDAIAGDIMAGEPEVQHHVIENENREKALEEQLIENEQTKFNNSFDPAVHVAGPDGKPLLNKNGSMKKKRGRKKGGKNADNFTIPQSSQDKAQDTGPVNPVNNEALEAAAVGKATAHLYMGVTSAIGGDEWKRDTTQTSTIENAFSQYFVATGKTDLPPGMTLLAILAADIAGNISKPKSRGRLEKIKIGMWGMFKRWKGRRVEKQVKREENATRQQKRDKETEQKNADAALSAATMVE